MDAAALHHVFDEGWMWVLRFDNGPDATVGFGLQPSGFGKYAGDPGVRRNSVAPLAVKY
jgi:hypothetical protein